MDNFFKERDLEFKQAKDFCNFQLRGDNKYYYADQCKKLKHYIERNGYYNYTADSIDKVHFTSNSYYGAKVSIILKSSGVTDIKTFNTLKEMLGFVVGFNACIDNQEYFNLQGGA